ncbi:hypothetical protein [Oceanobacillus kimchii]|uniref:hypothetical protein n=1 Tax=Oceanobacillus kimchii TaxID=746691 RepID=UPI00232EB62D|nr:hypothetical protein [Oceanobacillus kimchii]
MNAQLNKFNEVVNRYEAIEVDERQYLPADDPREGEYCDELRDSCTEIISAYCELHRLPQLVTNQMLESDFTEQEWQQMLAELKASA